MSEQQEDRIVEKLLHALKGKEIECVAFDDPTRESVAIIHGARKEVNADHGDVVMAFTMGKQLNTCVKEGFNRILRLVMIMGFIVIALLALKAWGVLSIFRDLHGGVAP